jgi:hypothetical protein
MPTLSQLPTCEDGSHSVPAAAQGSVDGAPLAQRVAKRFFAQSMVAQAPPAQ